MKIEMTAEEAKALYALLDIAVRNGGIQVAGNAAYFAKKLDEAVREEDRAARTAEDA